MFTVFTIGQAQAQACPGQAHTRPNLMSVGGIPYFFYFCLFFLLFGHFPRDLVFDMGPGPGYGARARPRPMSAGGNPYFLTFALFSYFWPGVKRINLNKIYFSYIHGVRPDLNGERTL